MEMSPLDLVRRTGGSDAPVDSGREGKSRPANDGDKGDFFVGPSEVGAEVTWRGFFPEGGLRDRSGDAPVSSEGSPSIAKRRLAKTRGCLKREGVKAAATVSKETFRGLSSML